MIPTAHVQQWRPLQSDSCVRSGPAMRYVSSKACESPNCCLWDFTKSTKSSLLILNITHISHSQIHACKKYFTLLHGTNILIEYNIYYFLKMLYFNFLLAFDEHNI